jgi:chromosome segregation protein
LTHRHAQGILNRIGIRERRLLRFSKLRLTGFKSFVDPTELLISDGLTGVVGPNGCGKSNLLEGLRWVMGENRPTAMRGGGMEDVIFAGAATRPARNFAEVSLLLDNSERLAPSGFNEADVLEVVRRITRDVGSAYKASGKDVRARDVQMLFADASTGAHSPSLVRQGQIAELINAKPRNRRRILEEAAGISGLYQRRHEAELKLNSTETNLSRVDDVLEQLAAQLTQLARQARQAARYRAIGEELRTAEGTLFFLRWREAEEARSKADAELRDRTTAAALAETEAQQSGTVRQIAEDGLPALREEEAIAAAVLQRLQVQRDTLTEQQEQALERIETLTNRVGQLERDLERESGLNRDAGETIKRLVQEAEELELGQEGHVEALEEAQAAARDSAAMLQTRESDFAKMTEDVARLAARHQSAHRFLSDSQTTLGKNEAGAESARSSVKEATDLLENAKVQMELATKAEAQSRDAAAETEKVLSDAEHARSTAQGDEAEARAARSEAEGEANALKTEVSALTKLVEREKSDGRQIIDQLQVEKGFEKALGAALADDLRAAKIDQSEAASGWVNMPAYAADQPLPKGFVSLANHVSATEVLGRRLAQIGLVDASEGARIQPLLGPGQRLVSRDGDLWRWDGYRTRAEDAPSAAALRLEQINRLSDLKEDLDLASKGMESARLNHEVATERLAQTSQADKSAREARREADRQMTEASRSTSKSEADCNFGQSRVESLRLAVTRHEEEAMLARSQVQEAESAVFELGDLETARNEIEDIKTTVEASRMTMMTRRSSFDELRREGEARVKRLSEVARESASWTQRLETAEQRSQELLSRKGETEEALASAFVAPDEIAQKREKMASAIEESEARRNEALDTLAVAEISLRKKIQVERNAERLASEARETRAGSQARAEAALENQIYAAERIVEELSQTPEELLNSLDADVEKMPRAEAVEAEVSRLKRQRDALGAVNLRAEEDAKEVEQEHDTLAHEKADLEDAVKTLRGGIASLNREGRERLLTAFEQVNSNFSMLFKHLFVGGEANLVMVESDDPLEAGLEIMCQPPGKKLSTLSLLSGGEQTLTALALIFGVFLANPAPICVLDEVDAPLDDANVTRFCDMLDEMCHRTNTRFLIITHHAVTMARMDRLFGVTMQEQGVSQLVSVDLKKAESLVA